MNKKEDKKMKNQQEVFAEFQNMAMEQKALASKLSELESEQREHNLVIKALEESEPERKCFRTIGGILVEETVKDVLPALRESEEQMKKMIEVLNNSCSQKIKDIVAYREKHGIKAPNEKADSKEGKGDSNASTSGVIVS